MHDDRACVIKFCWMEFVLYLILAISIACCLMAIPFIMVWENVNANEYPRVKLTLKYMGLFR